MSTGAPATSPAKPQSRGGRQRRFTADVVFEAALRLIDAEGLEALSMRRLAQELGVGVMTLYGYVRTKEEILDGVTTIALEALALDIDPRLSWEEQLTSALKNLHRTLQAHPGALELALAPHPMSGVAVNHIRESLLSVLRRAGFGKVEAVDAIVILVSYVFGFTNLQAPRDRYQSRDEQLASLKQLSPDEFPYLSDAAEAWAGRASEAAFERGLAHLLKGLRADLARSQKDAAAASGRPASRGRR